MASTPKSRSQEKQQSDYALLDDRQLVDLLRSGDELGLKEIFRRNSSMLHATANKVTRSSSAADEIVQEIFVKLWANPDSFDPDRGSLRSFLLVQAHRRSVDIIRSEQARTMRERRVDNAPTGRSASVEETALGRIELQSLTTAMKNLSDDERIAIELAYITGHTYHEVATILSVPDGTIKSRIRTGLRKIKETLDLNQRGVTDD